MPWILGSGFASAGRPGSGSCLDPTSGLYVGFSRPVFYHAQRALARAGLAGLVPQKPGPRRAHKIPPAVLVFLDRARAADPALRAPALARRVQSRFGYTVHPRSIERAFARAEEKRP